jgi:putative MATE family efflux protein
MTIFRDIPYPIVIHFDTLEIQYFVRALCMVALQELEEFRAEAGPDSVITSGSTWAAIWHMSWPSLVQMLTIAAASFTDVWVAGKLGSEIQAAIGVGGQIWFFMIMLAVALSAGATAIVSRYWGAKDIAGATEAARQSLVFGFIFGVSSATLGFLLAKPFFHLLGASPRVEQLGWDYLKWDIWSQIPFTMLWITNSIFRAKGNAKTPMCIWILMVTLTITLDFVFCLNPFHFGIAGFGMAWLIAGSIGTSVALFILSKSDIGGCLNPRDILHTGFDKAWILRLLKIGLPACIQDVAWVGGNFVLFLIFAKTKDPTSCQAAWAVGLRLEEMVAGLPIHALSMAVATIVGQNLGAKQPDRAAKAGWQVAAIGCGYNFLCGVLMFCLAEPIARMMSTDESVVRFTTSYLQIIGICEPFVAAWITLFGAMQGAGYTNWPMWASCFFLTVVRLPLAYYLTVTLAWGPSGTWFAMSSTAVMIGLVAIWRFKTGVWKTQKV